MIKIALLGSTGNIGTQVLKIIDRYPEKFEIVSLSACSNVDLLKEQVKKYNPKVVGVVKGSSNDFCGFENVKIYYGEQSILQCIVDDADIVFNALMGFNGVEALRISIEKKKNVCLANKEALVSAGELIMPLAKQNGVKIIPVDSEHSAIWQCLNFNTEKAFSRIILTTSGGACRDVDIDKLKDIKPKDALSHPTWMMGEKITIDCATMVNKGFEVLEAMHFFNCSIDQIDVLVHPQSIVHSMVEFEDGAILSQMGVPKMETPIQLALTYPKRLETSVGRLDLTKKPLNFYEVDDKRYPCFGLVKTAICKGGIYPCAISSADEEVVKLFLEEKILFTEIFDYLKYVLDNIESVPLTFENLKIVDIRAKELVQKRYKENV